MTRLPLASEEMPMIPMMPQGQQRSAPANPYLARPDNQRDGFAARDLGMVADGQDMRFGANSPASMFRGPTVRSAPGQYTVHPMMPQTGGTPYSQPAPDLGTSQYERNVGAMQWAAQHQSPSEGSIAQVLGMRNDGSGSVGVRIQGFPKAPNGQGPGFAFAPAGQIANAYNMLAGNNPRLNLGKVNVGPDGQPVAANGAPMGAAGLHDMMVQARRQRGQQNIEDLRSNMRGRLAVRAAQRGNYGPLAKLMQERGQGQQAAEGDGVDHNAVFGMAAKMMQDLGDNIPLAQKTKFMSGLATAMLAGRGGAAQIPGLLDAMGGAQVAQKRAELTKGQGGRMPAQNPIDYLSMLYNDWTGLTQRNQQNVRNGLPIEDPNRQSPGAPLPQPGFRGAYRKPGE